MTTFVWALLAVLAVDVIGKAYMLGRDELIERTRPGVAVDMVFSLAMFTWGVYALATAP